MTTETKTGEEWRDVLHPVLGPGQVPAYAWVITRDVITPKGETGYALGMSGPRQATDEDLRRAKDEGTRFRLQDDDGITYYYGRVWYAPNASEDDGNPLTDFGEGWAGCARLQYRNDSGEWEDII